MSWLASAGAGAGGGDGKGGIEAATTSTEAQGGSRPYLYAEHELRPLTAKVPY